MNNFNVKSFMHLIKKHKFANNKELEALCVRLELKRLGFGSSRVVFAISNKHVIKIAKGDAGYAQNEAEARICNHPLARNRVARIVGSDVNFGWLIVERATKVLNNHAWSTKHKADKESCFNFSFGTDFNLREIEVGILNGRKIAIDYGGTHKVMNDYY